MARGNGSRKGSSSRTARQQGRRSRSESGVPPSPPIASPTGTGGSYLFSGATAQSLIESAKKLFAQKGYDGTSVKELADAAHANISLVSYHFGGKEGLYRACLERFGQTRTAQAEKLLQEPQSSEEFEIRLGLFIEFMIDTFVTEPELSQLAFKESDLENSFMQEVFKNSFLGIFKSIVAFFTAAQNKGLIEDTLDPHCVSSIFFGSLSHYARMDKAASRYFNRSITDPQFKVKVISHLKRLYGKNLLVK